MATTFANRGKQMIDFLEDDASRPAWKSDLYYEVFESPVFPRIRRSELEGMIALARQREVQTVMEIGCGSGGILYHWCKCLPKLRRLIACDLKGIDHLATEFENAFPHVRFLWVKGSSYKDGSVGQVQRHLYKAGWRSGKVTIDLLFINGNKATIHSDFNCYRSMMTPGGIVCAHGVTTEPGRTSFQSIKAKSHGCKVDLIHFPEESYLADQRRRQGMPATTDYERWLRDNAASRAGIGVVYLPTER